MGTIRKGFKKEAVRGCNSVILLVLGYVFGCENKRRSIIKWLYDMASHLKSGLDNFKFWYMEAQFGVPHLHQTPCHIGVPFQSFYFIVQTHIPLCPQSIPTSCNIWKDFSNMELMVLLSIYTELKYQDFHYTVLTLIIYNCHLQSVTIWARNAEQGINTPPRDLIYTYIYRIINWKNLDLFL
jgi:hypothetical protein